MQILCVLVLCYAMMSSLAQARVWPSQFGSGLFNPVRGSKNAAKHDNGKSFASKLGWKATEAFNRYVVPVAVKVDEVVDKYTPIAAKPHVAKAKEFVKQSYIETRDEIAACRDIYASARNNYERLDKVIYIIQTHKRQLLYSTGFYLFLRGLRGIGERR